MRLSPVPTYLVPERSIVAAEPWTTITGAEALATVDHWDPATDLTLTRVLTIDTDELRSQCGLGRSSGFAVSSSWRAPNRTRLGDVGEVIELGDRQGLLRVVVSVCVLGSCAGGRVDLRTRLVLRSPGHDPSPVAPARPGSILWHDVHRLQLEGGAARFPMAVVDFRTIANIPDTAAWYLDWNAEELGMPVLGGVRLLLNGSNELIVDIARTGSTHPAMLTVRSLIIGDVARQLITSALKNDEFIDHRNSFADESVGRMVSDLIAAVWPGRSAAQLRDRFQQLPARFEAEIQAALDVAR